jgi:hypothetical protein
LEQELDNYRKHPGWLSVQDWAVLGCVEVLRQEVGLGFPA